MNIRKSALITVFLGCVFATQALAAGHAKCSALDVNISEPILDDYILLVDQIVTDHGYLARCSAKNGQIDCLFIQSFFYGPDATLSFKRKTDGQIAKIRVQQNFCGFEAGNITVQPTRGKWVYRAREGSFEDNQHGDIWLDQVSLDN